MIAFIVGVLVVVVGLALSIGLHEIGHLVPAKLFGVRVSQYMIGFGPTLWSRKKGETRYGVKLLPLGGFIAMSGMFPPASDGAARDRSRSFFGAMVQDARDSSSESVRPGEEDRAFYRKPVWQRIIIMLGGPLMNLVLATVLFAIILLGIGLPQASTTIGSLSTCVVPASRADQTTCQADDPAAPGQAAGLKPGDKIVSIDGTKITSWMQATELIRKSAGAHLDFVVHRDGTERTIAVTPMLSERYAFDAAGHAVLGADGKPTTVQVGFIGIGPATERVAQPVATVVETVGTTISGVVGVVVNLPQRLIAVAEAAFGPGERDPNGPISVVGVGRAAGEIASVDSAPVIDRVAVLLGLLASLNIALFVFNLIPLLPLDGGHVLGAIVEAVRRRFAKLFKRADPGPIDMARFMPVTFVVVIVLVAMSALLIYADIVKPVKIF